MPPTDALSPLFEEFPAISTDEWTTKIREDIGREDYDDVLQWDSIEGISLPAFLRQEDLPALPHVDKDNEGPPLLAGTDMPANTWNICQDVTHPDPGDARRLVERAVDGGVTGIQLGRRPTEPAGRSFAESVGVDALGSILADVELDTVSIHLDGGALAPILFAALHEIDERRFDSPALSGAVMYDPSAALATGTVADPDDAIHIADDLARTVPDGIRSLTVDLRPYHEAGASAVQELSFGLGALTELLSALLDRGHSLEDLLPRLQLVTGVSTSYFVEIGKLRALRLLVPQVVHAFAGEASEDVTLRPRDVHVHAETSRRTETVFDPYVNMLRATTEAMAAVVGGCDSLSVRPFDASLTSPDTFGTRIARNVQLILGEEAHLDVVADPGAGAYYLEAATDRLAQAAWSAFQTLEREGGLLDNLRSSQVQRDIEEVRTQRLQEVDERDRVLVGTNHYPDLDERRRGDLSFSDSTSVPSRGDRSGARTLNEIRSALQSGKAVESILSGLASGPTEIAPLPQIRISERMEELRLRTERHAEQTGRVPTVLLVPIGPTKARSARANFARNVFGVAGFDVVEPLRFSSPEEAAEAAVDDDADIVVLCSADGECATLTPAMRDALDRLDHSALLVVAGNPEQIDTDLPADDYVHQGMSLREALETFQERLGLDDPNESPPSDT